MLSPLHQVLRRGVFWGGLLLRSVSYEIVVGVCPSRTGSDGISPPSDKKTESRTLTLVGGGGRAGEFSKDCGRGF